MSHAKTKWPEAVGMTGDAAKALIEKEFSGHTWMLPEDACTTAEYNTTRVKIYVRNAVEKNYPDGRCEYYGGIVTVVPRVG